MRVEKCYKTYIKMREFWNSAKSDENEKFFQGRWTVDDSIRWHHPFTSSPTLSGLRLSILALEGLVFFPLVTGLSLSILNIVDARLSRASSLSLGHRPISLDPQHRRCAALEGIFFLLWCPIVQHPINCPASIWLVPDCPVPNRMVPKCPLSHSTCREFEVQKMLEQIR